MQTWFMIFGSIEYPFFTFAAKEQIDQYIEKCKPSIISYIEVTDPVLLNMLACGFYFQRPIEELTKFRTKTFIKSYKL